MNAVIGDSLHRECADVRTVPRTDVDTIVDMASKVFILVYGGKPGI